MRKRELIEIKKQKTGWTCEYRLGRQRMLFLIKEPFDKTQIIEYMAKKFNMTQDKIERVMR